MMKYIGVTLIVLLFICLIIISFKNNNNKFKDHYKQFNSTNLVGEIEYLKISYKGVLIKLKENKFEYIFYPGNELNNNKIFEDFAEKGDIIIKPANSDTLKLIKNGKEYFFTFQKFNVGKNK